MSNDFWILRKSFRKTCQNFFPRIQGNFFGRRSLRALREKSSAVFSKTAFFIKWRIFPENVVGVQPESFSILRKVFRHCHWSCKLHIRYHILELFFSRKSGVWIEVSGRLWNLHCRCPNGQNVQEVPGTFGHIFRALEKRFCKGCQNSILRVPWSNLTKRLVERSSVLCIIFFLTLSERFHKCFKSCIERIKMNTSEKFFWLCEEEFWILSRTIWAGWSKFPAIWLTKPLFRNSFLNTFASLC